MVSNVESQKKYSFKKGGAVGDEIALASKQQFSSVEKGKTLSDYYNTNSIKKQLPNEVDANGNKITSKGLAWSSSIDGNSPEAAFNYLVNNISPAEYKKALDTFIKTFGKEKAMERILWYSSEASKSGNISSLRDYYKNELGNTYALKGISKENCSNYDVPGATRQINRMDVGENILVTFKEVNGKCEVDIPDPGQSIPSNGKISEFTGIIYHGDSATDDYIRGFQAKVTGLNYGGKPVDGIQVFIPENPANVDKAAQVFLMNGNTQVANLKGNDAISYMESTKLDLTSAARKDYTLSILDIATRKEGSVTKDINSRYVYAETPPGALDRYGHIGTWKLGEQGSWKQDNVILSEKYKGYTTTDKTYLANKTEKEQLDTEEKPFTLGY